MKFKTLLFHLERMSAEELEQEAVIYIRTYGRSLPLIAFAPRTDNPPSPDNPMMLITGTDHK